MPTTKQVPAKQSCLKENSWIKTMLLQVYSSFNQCWKQINAVIENSNQFYYNFYFQVKEQLQDVKMVCYIVKFISNFILSQSRQKKAFSSEKRIVKSYNKLIVILAKCKGPRLTTKSKLFYSFQRSAKVQKKKKCPISNMAKFTNSPRLI